MRDGVWAAIPPSLDAESEHQHHSSVLQLIKLLLGRTEGTGLAVLEELLQEADLPARVHPTSIRQRLPLNDDELGFASCGCQACDKAMVGHPLLRSLLHAVLHVHDVLLVV